MAERKNLTISLPIEKHRRLKLAATKQDTTMTNIIMEFIDEAIRKWEGKESKNGND